MSQARANTQNQERAYTPKLSKLIPKDKARENVKESTKENPVEETEGDKDINSVSKNTPKMKNDYSPTKKSSYSYKGKKSSDNFVKAEYSPNKNKKDKKDANDFLNKKRRQHKKKEESLFSSSSSSSRSRSRSNSTRYPSRLHSRNYRNSRSAEKRKVSPFNHNTNYMKRNTYNNKGSDFNNNFGNNRPKLGWVCINSKCSSINFLSRTDCFRCGSSIPPTPAYQPLPERISKPEGKNFQRHSMPRFEKKTPHNPMPYNPRREPYNNREDKFRSSDNYKNPQGKSCSNIYEIIPKTQPIISEYSHMELSQAIQVLKSIKEVKSSEEKLKLIEKIDFINH